MIISWPCSTGLTNGKHAHDITLAASYPPLPASLPKSPLTEELFRQVIAELDADSQSTQSFIQETAEETCRT